MSDREFENYLALLSRLLKLGGKQRNAIAGELRSHLEDRLDELLARGVSRDEAIQQALAEFGDAAVIAAEFASIRGNQRKRWLMRLTTASIAATLLIAAGIFTFWPGNNAGPGAAKLVAQVSEQTKQADPTTGEKPAAQKRAAVRDILDRRLPIDFSESSLSAVMQQLSEQNGITVFIDARRLEDVGVNIDTPVTMSFGEIRLRTFLDLMLGNLDLTYLVKDDVLVITTAEHAENERVIRVYDCRELLDLPRPRGSVLPKVSNSGGFFMVQDEPVRKGDAAASGSDPAPAASNASPSAGQPATGGLFGASGGPQSAEEVSDAQNLIQFITSIVDPDSWSEAGGPGSIAEYKGLVSVASTQEVHEKVERLLNMLHKAGNLKELKVTVVE